MALHFPFTLFCFTSVLLFSSLALADNNGDTARALLESLKKFQPMVNKNLEMVADTIKKSRQPARAASLGSNTEKLTLLQAKVDKVGRLLNIIADLTWDRIYFATSGGKIMVHSLETGDTNVVVERPHNATTGDVGGFYGVTYDPEGKKMYFSSKHAIYRANLDGTEIEMALSTMTYGLISGLSFDWIHGDLYGVSSAGMVLTGKARVKGRMICATVFKEESGPVNGIAVDPNSREMYWAAQGKVLKSNLDGSERSVLLEGLGEPVGILIKNNKELITTDSTKNEIRITAIEGTSHNSSSFKVSSPTGIAYGHKKFICVGTGKSLVCANETSPFVFSAVFTGPDRINHLFTPGFKYVYGRGDHFNASPSTPSSGAVYSTEPATAEESEPSTEEVISTEFAVQQSSTESSSAGSSSTTAQSDVTAEVRNPGEGTSGGEIFNGNQVNHGDYAYHVSLQATDQASRHFCGASIIHPKFLLSVAHCFADRYKVPHIRAVAGEHDLKLSGGNREQIRQVTRVISHEKYNERTFDDNVALLELNQPFNFDNKYVRSVQLWDSTWELPRRAVVTGWNLMNAVPRSGSLLAAEVPIRDHGGCAERFGRYNHTVTSTMICAGGYRNFCNGDSGGPLTCYKSLTNGRKEPYLCGIASWGVSCDGQTSKHYPGVYTNVAKYKEWIERNLPEGTWL